MYFPKNVKLDYEKINIFTQKDIEKILLISSRTRIFHFCYSLTSKTFSDHI